MIQSIVRAYSLKRQVENVVKALKRTGVQDCCSQVWLNEYEYPISGKNCMAIYDMSIWKSESWLLVSSYSRTTVTLLTSSSLFISTGIFQCLRYLKDTWTECQLFLTFFTMSSSESFGTPTHVGCISVDGLTSSSISTWIGLARIVGFCLNTFNNFLSFLLYSGFELAMGHSIYPITKSGLNATKPKKARLEERVWNQIGPWVVKSKKKRLLLI